MRSLYLPNVRKDTEANHWPPFDFIGIATLNALLKLRFTMFRSFYLCLLTLLVCIEVFGNEAFTIFAPDAANRQLLSLSVNATMEGVSIKQDEPLKLPFSPSGTAIHPNGNYMFVTTGGNDVASVASVEILSSGKLRMIDSSKLEKPAGYTSVDRSGRYFLMVNYQTGIISVYAIDKQGKVGELVGSLKSPNKEAHSILTTPDNRFAYIPCVKNNNALYQYAFDEKTGQLTPLEPFNVMPPAMFGPRHVAYHPTLPIVYFSNEQQLGVSVYEIGTDGQLTDQQHATTMPRRSPFEQGKRDLHASDLVIAPDAKLLFVAVRDFNGDEDSVFSFRVETDGKLSLLTRTLVDDIPWKLAMSPSGNYLIVSSSGAKRLSIFKVGSDGSLSQSASIDLPSGATDMSVMGLN
jgi:6-phosphogluconolactonase